MLLQKSHHLPGLRLIDLDHGLEEAHWKTRLLSVSNERLDIFWETTSAESATSPQERHDRGQALGIVIAEVLTQVDSPHDIHDIGSPQSRTKVRDLVRERYEVRQEGVGGVLDE